MLHRKTFIHSNDRNKVKRRSNVSKVYLYRETVTSQRKRPSEHAQTPPTRRSERVSFKGSHRAKDTVVSCSTVLELKAES